MNATAAITVGDRFEQDESIPYTVDGVKRFHTFTKVCEVTEITEVGFSYEVTEVINEANRPSFAGAPTSGSVAWFAFPLYIARGTVRVG